MGIVVVVILLNSRRIEMIKRILGWATDWIDLC